MRRPGRFALIVGAITTIGLLLRLPPLADSLFGDELSTYYIVTGNSLGRVLDLLDGDTVDLNPPAVFVLGWALDGLGDPAQSLRLTSLVAGTAAIPLTYLLGVWTIGRVAALVGAALMALSPFLIFYSTEARAYALVTCLVLLSTLALLRALETRRGAWWVVYAACSCAAMYAHYPAIFVLLAQFAWAFWTYAGQRLALVLANVGAAVGYLPWLPALRENTRSPGAKVIEFLQPFDLQAIRVDLGRWSIGHPLVPLESVPGQLAIALLLAGLAAAALGLALRARRTRLPRPSARMVLVIVLALATPVEIALYSAIGDSVWISRNLITSWPGLALVAGAFVTAGRGPLRGFAVAAVVAAFAIGGFRTLDTDFRRSDYDGAAGFIERAGVPGDPVVEVPAFSPGPLTPVGDVALNRFGQPAPGPYRVLRLGAAPLDVALRARPYAPVPVPAPENLARQAGRLARGGTLFLVSPGSAPVSGLRGESAREAGLESALQGDRRRALITAALSPLGAFLDALPARFRHVETRTFTGFVPVSVYVFRDRGD